MDLPVLARPFANRLAEATRGVLERRLASVVVYGSAADGDILAGYSDFDCLLAVRAPVTLGDALAIETTMGGADIAPFTYYQPTFVATDSARGLLVPNAFVVISGDEPDPAWVLTDEDMRASADKWLQQLPVLLAKDAVDWSMTTPSTRPRRARLHLTRVKPSLRALLVREGYDPSSAWAATWSDLLDGLATMDVRAVDRVTLLLAAASRHDDRTIAIACLKLLDTICANHLDAGPGDLRVAT